MFKWKHEFYNGFPKPIQFLAQKKFSTMKFNLLISLFGVYRGVLIYKKSLCPSKFIGSPPQINFFFSQSTKRQFEIKNPEYIKLLKDIEYKVARKHNSKTNHEQPISFNKRGKSYLSNQRQRMKMINNDEICKIQLGIVIKLQKIIRGFISRKNMNNIINLIILQQSAAYIIKIQATYRRYMQIKRIKLYQMIYHLINKRTNGNILIKKKMKEYHSILAYKKDIIKDIIISYRNDQIIKIQNTYRTYHLVKLVKTIITYEKTQYVLTYPFYAKEVDLQLYSNTSIRKPKQYLLNDKSNMRLFTFDYCSLRNTFILYINKYEIDEGKYRCQLIVDGCATCDGRLPHIEYTDGKFYNLIHFKNDKEDNSRNSGTDIGSESNISEQDRRVSPMEEDDLVKGLVKGFN